MKNWERLKEKVECYQDKRNIFFQLGRRGMAVCYYMLVEKIVLVVVGTAPYLRGSAMAVPKKAALAYRAITTPAPTNGPPTPSRGRVSLRSGRYWLLELPPENSSSRELKAHQTLTPQTGASNLARILPVVVWKLRSELALAPAYSRPRPPQGSQLPYGGGVRLRFPEGEREQSILLDGTLPPLPLHAVFSIALYRQVSSRQTLKGKLTSERETKINFPQTFIRNLPDLDIWVVHWTLFLEHPHY